MVPYFFMKSFNREANEMQWNVRHAAVIAVATTGLVALMAAGCSPDMSADAAAQEGERWGLVIHGGAGTILRANLTPELEAEYHAAMEASLRAGYAILERGGNALDAVEAAVQVMEESPLFNAGKGAVFTAEGTNELDAAIMYGPTLEAGAVAGVTRVRSPIALARLVMERSPHVFMAREGAEAFGQEHGIEMVDPSYFYTERRWEALQRAQEAERAARAAGEAPGAWLAGRGNEWKLGTVGAAALDKEGNLAAATSTGGMTNKRFGRIGDVPVIGAGTYANNLCAISATGHGEFFIRNVVAHSICTRMEYTGGTLEEAAHEIVMNRLVAQEADGGIIAIDRTGNMSLTFNSAGMYRGYIRADGRPVTAIYGDDDVR
jgi:L-asparaginase / beta-aspartyl-peptidase